ncbi:helix-turn-helix domain-containing protein [Dictyobacter aurantiacus]|uniref:HTH lysR-type domain-containing protein n=1 Tax=Dictyobacter aurantiacus TaxID=1936993 RepID=A0A401ZAD8_9CHLR|nr:LysR family transcriptional regulator [Dictyobacter aurantiacus]GCE03841.1 hypothetical protein KDAU_11700 [Dictyobacter aurantiacus]
MQLRQLEYVVALIQWKTMRKAAQHLYVSEATISQQIRELETELGLSIFQREGNPLEPGLDLQVMTDTAYVETQHSFDQFTTAEPLEAHLKALRKPLLVIFGAEDQIAVGAANDLYEYHMVPGVQVIVLPGVGHSPQVEAPNKTAELIVAFLNNRP